MNDVRRQFDLVVIGTGTAAGVVAHKCRRAGWSVAVIDSRPFGGTCALRGCDPKKVLVGVAEALDQVNRLRGHGLRTEDLRIDWPELVRFKRDLIAAVPSEREGGFLKAGISTFHGRACFVGSSAISVEGDVLEGRHVLIATGAKPIDLSFQGQQHLITSERFLELDALPPRVLFVGGGYISFEFAHVAARAGVKATILHHGERPLHHFDPGLVDLLVDRSRSLGIDVRLGSTVTAVERSNAAFIVHAQTEGRSTQLVADLVVHGAGRVPEIDDLDLDAAGVKWDTNGVVVNEHLQSVSNPGVYAAGDAAANGAPRLTPVAALDGHTVAANLLHGSRQQRTADYSVVPSVVFTIPPLAATGLLEGDARHRGLAFDVHQGDMSSWHYSRRVSETHSGFKVLVENTSGRILGAHLLGPRADDAINLFAVAMRTGATASVLKQTLYAYPTAGSDLPYML
ncbi:MAG TPA: NAD(P)/FAD-dependent oxidoreductase [Vicinamibacterales bacterium]|nr:NAD(P)/FAD-dependent oxidoreductase [Vicinamibacterales bacterium]